MSDDVLLRTIEQLRPRRGGGLAVFDADGVLWHGDVSEDFAEWMIGRGRFDAARWPGYLATAARDPAAACFEILELYTGIARDDLDREVAAFWRDAPPRRWLRTARSAVDAARAVGLAVWVCSGTPAPVLQPLPEHLAVDGVLALEVEFDADGRATGRCTGIPTVGAGKARRLRAERPEPVLWAIGNSILDAPMLELSEVAAWAVNPDAELRAVARRAGWTIAEEPEGSGAEPPKGSS